jgi:ubiquinone/menaquinone biosynthesis C-methylase UbiE
MTAESNAVSERYAIDGILDRVARFLQARGVDPQHPSFEDLFPLDQLHGRGIQATHDHIERARIKPGMHVLDLGCGIGGGSRVLAAVCGCRVTGVDLSQQFLEIAAEFTRRCGMTEAIEFRQGDALDLPFDDETFDHVWCHAVSMNIPDKSKLGSEVARVLKPNGRFSCYEMAQGPGGPLIFPLPWATDPSASFVVTPAEMRHALEEGGLSVVEQTDLSDLNMQYARETRIRGERGEPPVTANYVVMGDDFLERLKNASKCAMEGRVIEQFILAAKKT